MRHTTRTDRSLRLIAVMLVAGTAMGGGLAAAGAVQGSRPKAEKPDWMKEIDAKLGKRMTCDFVETPLTDIVAFLANLTGVNFILDPLAVKGGETVTLKVENMELRNVMAWITRLVGLAYSIESEAVFISTQKRIDEGPLKVPKRLPAKIQEQFDKKVSVDFVDCPLEDVAEFLRSLTSLNLLVDPKADPKTTKITLRVKEMSLGAALGWLTRTSVLRYRVEGENAIYIFK